MFDSRQYVLLVGLVVLVAFTRPALAFGAGNIAGISKVEGQNCKSTSSRSALPFYLIIYSQGVMATSRMHFSPS
jgi:Heterokaryon incompatibility protein Het-C